MLRFIWAIMPWISSITADFSGLNAKAKQFVVNGTGIPEVNFDIGESYAGYLANTPSGNSSLFFWYFPTTNAAAGDEITIWLNGGPGCSSLAGLIQENGPFLWQPGTYAPIQNPYSWTNLTNIVYVDHPAGTGMSPGPSTVKDEIDIAHQFMDFWVRFVDTFELWNRRVYLAGESYAGQYIPYIASAMLDEQNSTYFNVSGLLMFDPSINSRTVLSHAPAVLAMKHFKHILALNDTFISEIEERAQHCGYTEFMEQALRFPPAGILQPAPTHERPGCDIWNSIVKAEYYVNPCFNYYHIVEFCPYLWNVMGFPVSDAGQGPDNYFNRSDVQKAINAYPTDYQTCGKTTIFQGEDAKDQSVPSGLGPLPSVIERTNNTVIAHGLLDFLLLANGTLATIQNMTWSDVQGFQNPPSDPFFVPYHPWWYEQWESLKKMPPFTRIAGSGILGTSHTERGLTFASVNLAGHQVPQYSPGAAYRLMEFLLGRISSLSEVTDSFTTGTG
ncbi:hypothetical protein Aspvir_002323 [Aspergillus viridinutans]|uniref:Carboxypeptidase n=1 Tax=Aspergillus viridinutans TaxID=75553 RepID=A0A9P3F9J1_ASPVI|nr:uncharacterized protein Aspvir_002323 [Aspergillus viridinutans]GIK06673.1 hypothetical protein Aspvir_002323 [Aspergillus viridinutans]